MLTHQIVELKIVLRVVLHNRPFLTQIKQLFRRIGFQIVSSVIMHSFVKSLHKWISNGNHTVSSSICD